ncbi:MAG: TerB family tellurite resistance protein [Verrucomicrobiota bacterium]
MKNSFSEAERRALMDLLVAGAYADGHLAIAESDCVQRFLGTIGFNSEDERRRFVDESYTRVNHHMTSKGDQRAFLASLAAVFQSEGSRREAFGILGSVLASDGKLGDQEHKYLSDVRALLHFD